jgi:hypothetical protein
VPHLDFGLQSLEGGHPVCSGFEGFGMLLVLFSGGYDFSGIEPLLRRIMNGRLFGKIRAINGFITRYFFMDINGISRILVVDRLDGVSRMCLYL